jgi:hypothetical protein
VFSDSEIQSALERKLSRPVTPEELAAALPGIKQHLDWLRDKQPTIWAKYSNEQRIDAAAGVATEAIHAAVRRRKTHPILRVTGDLWNVAIIAIALLGMGFLILSIPMGWVGATIAIVVGGIIGWKNSKPHRPWEPISRTNRVVNAIGGAGIGMWVLLMLMGLQLSAEGWG